MSEISCACGLFFGERVGRKCPKGDGRCCEPRKAQPAPSAEPPEGWFPEEEWPGKPKPAPSAEPPEGWFPEEEWPGKPKPAPSAEPDPGNSVLVQGVGYLTIHSLRQALSRAGLAIVSAPVAAPCAGCAELKARLERARAMMKRVMPSALDALDALDALR